MLEEGACEGRGCGGAPAGRNRVTLRATDSQAYVALVLLVRRRAEPEVRALMAPKLSTAAALARVREQVRRRGGRNVPADCCSACGPLQRVASTALTEGCAHGTHRVRVHSRAC
jgi:hypothetical protein